MIRILNAARHKPEISSNRAIHLASSFCSVTDAKVPSADNLAEEQPMDLEIRSTVLP